MTDDYGPMARVGLSPTFCCASASSCSSRPRAGAAGHYVYGAAGALLRVRLLRFRSPRKDLHAGEAVVPHELLHHLDARAAGGELELEDGTGFGMRLEMAKTAAFFAIHVDRAIPRVDDALLLDAARVDGTAGLGGTTVPVTVPHSADRRG